MGGELGGLIGVVHLAAMPGDPRYESGGFTRAEVWARRDMEALKAGGISTVVIENFGSAPFFKGTRADPLPPHQVAFIAQVGRIAREEFGLRVGINCLRNDAYSAIGIAATCGAAFVRVNVHSGAYVTDQGLIEGDAARTLRYRRELEATDVAILADVLVKHAQPLAAKIDPVTEVHDCLDRGLAAGVIVTGSATGAPVDEGLLKVVAGAATGRPVFIGSGLTLENAERLLPLVQGAIVGSWLKEDGKVHAPVDVTRVRRLVEAAQQIWA